MDAYEHYVQEMRQKYLDAKNHHCQQCGSHATLLVRVYHDARKDFVWVCVWCKQRITKDTPTHEHVRT